MHSAKVASQKDLSQVSTTLWQKSVLAGCVLAACLALIGVMAIF